MVSLNSKGRFGCSESDTSLSMKCGEQWKHVAAMVAVNFAMAITNVLIKKLLNDGLNHMIIVTYRQAISAFFLTPIAYFWERKSRPKFTARILGLLFVSAFLGATLTQILFLLGLKHTSATFSCAFTNLVPAITFLFALPLGLEKVNVRNHAGRAKVLGVLVCISGAMFLTLFKGVLLAGPHPPTTPQTTNRSNFATSTKKVENWAIGSILLITACTLWSGWFLLQASISRSYPCQYSSTAIMFSFGSVQSAILTLIVDRDFSKWILKGKLEILSVTYTGMIGSGICYVVMFWCVKRKGPLFTAAYTPLMQMFVAVFDFFFLYGQIYLGSIIGSVLVIIGLYVVLWGRSNEAEESKIKQPEVTQEAEECNL